MANVENIPKSKLYSEDGTLNIHLYHGTSTLFLDSILKHGLAGRNPVKEWKLVELCNEVYNLSKKYLRSTKLYRTCRFTLKDMAEQTNIGLNFQHGDTYLTPSILTACNYAVRNQYGSELLSYIIKFLKELSKRNIEYVQNDLQKRYKKVFELMDMNPSPILIKISNVHINSLLDEIGRDAMENFEAIEYFMNEEINAFYFYIQQFNFRLLKAMNKSHLSFYSLNVEKFKKLNHDCFDTYYKIMRYCLEPMDVK